MELVKTEKDFDGWWVKNIKHFKGHEGEPLVQCSVYRHGRRIGFYSDDSWGGPAQLQDFSKAEMEALTEHANKVVTDFKYEREAVFIGNIIDAAENLAWIRRTCKKRAVFVVPGDNKNFHQLNNPYSQSAAKWIRDKYGAETVILNELDL